MSKTERFGELLVEQGLINKDDLRQALGRQDETLAPIGEILLEMQLVPENELLRALSQHLGINFLNIAENDAEVVDNTLASLLTRDLCQRLMVVPLFLYAEDSRRYLTLAMADPTNREAIREVEHVTEATVNPVLTMRAAIDTGIEKMYAFNPALDTETEISESGAFGVVLLLNRLLARAVEMLASDIHIEPRPDEVVVRYRVDGALRKVENLPYSLLEQLVHRVKVLASEKNTLMRTDNRRIPQDGSFARVVGGRAVDFRVSSFPTINGEKVVLRILDRDTVGAINRIADVGMPPALEQQFRRCIRQTGGIIIATGPTGSGKTTTLYAAINDINHTDRNIVTVEDPVEYQAPPYVCQSSINREWGFTYPIAIRSVLRQDPDVILIGEIRDLESAEMAVEAALTGHLILTTLHTEDAAGAIVRLLDIGIEQFMISSTVVSAVSQRLLRHVCPDCSTPCEVDRETLLDLRIDAPVADEILDNRDRLNIRAGAGCPRCYQTGYSGRLGVFEMLSVTPVIKQLILKKKTSDLIADAARSDGRINMIFEDAVRRVLRGDTTFEELRRVHRGDYKLKGIEEIFDYAGDLSPLS